MKRFFSFLAAACIFILSTGQPARAQSHVREQLAEAIWDENVPRVAELVTRLDDIDFGDAQHDPVLWQAVSSANLQIVRTVVDAGASVNVRESNWKMPAFNQAASVGELKIVEYLIKEGADITLVDKFGGNALEEAAFQGHKKLATKLKDLGIKTKFPVHVAAGIGEIEDLKKLLTSRTDINRPTGWGNSALFFAVNGRNVKTTQLLLNKGAKHSVKNVFGCTALHYAASLEDPRFTEMLIRNGADVNAKNKDGESPLDWASSNKIAMLLKAAGAKPGTVR